MLPQISHSPFGFLWGLVNDGSHTIARETTTYAIIRTYTVPYVQSTVARTVRSSPIISMYGTGVVTLTSVLYVLLTCTGVVTPSTRILRAEYCAGLVAARATAGSLLDILQHFILFLSNGASFSREYFHLFPYSFPLAAYQERAVSALCLWTAVPLSSCNLCCRVPLAAFLRNPS